MFRVTFGVFAILLLIRNGRSDDDSSPCSLQFEMNIRCVLDLVGSEDSKLIENKTKTIFHTTCAPDYPLDCFSEFEAAKQCYVDTKNELDNPGPLKIQKDAANAAVDACFGKKSAASSIFSGLEDIFLPQPVKVLSGNLGKSLWGEGDGRPGIPMPPVAVAMLKGLGVTTPSPPDAGSGSEDNSTGSGDGHNLFGRKECAPQTKQFMCTFKELNKLGDTDPAFKNATETLKKGVDICKKLLQTRCTPSTSEENNCVSDAHIPLILAFVDQIVGCMKDKGYTLPPLLPRGFPKFTPPPRLLP